MVRRSYLRLKRYCTSARYRPAYLTNFTELGAAQCRPQVAKHSVDSPKLLKLHGPLAAAGDGAVVDSAHALGNSETAQPVGDHRQWKYRRLGHEFFKRRLGERACRKARQVRPPILGGLHCRDERNLVLRTPAGLAARTLATEVGVIDLHAPRELPRVLTQLHDLHQLVLDQPGSSVANAPFELQCSHVVLGLREQVHCQEPAGQRQLAGAE
jgi:hypothetical protein